MEDSRYLWRYHVRERREERLGWPGHWFFLHPLSDGIHVLMHERLEDGSHRFTIRRIAEVERELATAHVREGQRWSFEGPSELWRAVPRYVLAWSDELGRSVLLHLDPDDPDVDVLPWYTDDAYDTMYQGLIMAYEIPASHLIIVTVQRDSHPVVYDPRARRVVARLRLNGRLGNPSLYFRRKAPELWADDYDTLLRVRPGSWEVLDSLVLHPELGGMRHFIGSFWFPPNEEVCVVARPFAGDVVLVDPTSFQIVETVRLGDQPLDAVLLRDRTVIARDWKTLRVLRGTSHLSRG